MINKALFLFFILFLYLPCSVEGAAEIKTSHFDQTPWTEIYRSVDGGRTFEVLKTKEKIIDVLPDSIKKGRLIGLTYDGKIVSSDDRGASWKVRADAGKQREWGQLSKLFIAPSGTIFVWSVYGLTRIDGESVETIRMNSAYDMAASGEIILLQGVSPDENYKRLFISRDDGRSWKRVYKGIAIGSIYTSPAGTIFTAGGDRVYRLKNGKMEPTSLKRVVANLKTSTSGRILASAWPILISGDDGLSWQPLIEDEEAASILGEDDKTVITIAEKGGELFKRKGKYREEGGDYIVHCTVRKEKRRGNKIYKTCWINDYIWSDLERKWRKAMGFQKKNFTYFRFQVAPKENTFIIAYGSRVYRTFTGGDKWEKVKEVRTSLARIVVMPGDEETILMIGVEWPDL